MLLWVSVERVREEGWYLSKISIPETIWSEVDKKYLSQRLQPTEGGPLYDALWKSDIDPETFHQAPPVIDTSPSGDGVVRLRCTHRKFLPAQDLAFFVILDDACALLLSYVTDDLEQLADEQWVWGRRTFLFKTQGYKPYLLLMWVSC